MNMLIMWYLSDGVISVIYIVDRTTSIGRVYTVCTVYNNVHISSYYVAPGIVQFHIQTTLNNTEVIVMWRPPLQPNGVITSYEVMYQIYEHDYTTAVHTRLESTDRSYTIKNLGKCMEMYSNMAVWV